MPPRDRKPQCGGSEDNEYEHQRDRAALDVHGRAGSPTVVSVKLGLINWVINKIAARVIRAPRMHLFTTLGQHKRLFWAWFFFGAVLYAGRLPQTRHRTGDPAGGASAGL